MRLSAEPLYTAAALQARVAQLGSELCRQLDDTPTTALVVMQGAFFFGADLLRHLPPAIGVDYLHPVSYNGTASTGTVRLERLPRTPLHDRHVLIVEDIVDTGRSLAAMHAWLREQAPARVTTCCLFDKPARRVVPHHPDLTGFHLDDHFIVGYGLDYNGAYRTLPAVYTLEAD